METGWRSALQPAFAERTGGGGGLLHGPGRRANRHIKKRTCPTDGPSLRVYASIGADWFLPSPSGSSVWSISWKMVFLSEVLWRDAELPPLCRAGRTFRTTAPPTFTVAVIGKALTGEIKNPECEGGLSCSFSCPESRPVLLCLGWRSAALGAAWRWLGFHSGFIFSLWCSRRRRRSSWRSFTVLQREPVKAPSVHCSKLQF